LRVLGGLSMAPDNWLPATVERTRGLLPPLAWFGLLLLCSAYLQGALCKLIDLACARAEMVHFGLSPPLPFALAVIVFELVASMMVLSGRCRWLGALALALFTVAANFLANAFWALPTPGNIMAMNGFFEHLGLAGAFLMVAVDDLQRAFAPRRSSRL
jgi:uncharacterized membrane protein YphA (DoxX/SURF4 family)